MRFWLCAALLFAPSLVAAQSVDILYEGTGYTPPFYQGGARWSQEGSVALFAVPQGLGDPAALYYKWTKDGTVLGSASGVGQNSLRSIDPLFSKPQRIKVEIMSDNDETIAESSVTIVPIAPEALIYEENPLLGFLFNREASSGYRLVEPEATLAAFPFLFSTHKRIDPSIDYSWRSSGGEDSAASAVTYRAPEGTSGSAAVSVKVINPSTIRQAAYGNFLIQFGNEH